MGKKNVVKIEPAQLFGIAEIMFDQGKQVTLTVTGNSMYPFLRGGTDSVELRRAGMKDIKKGDIVLINCDGSYVLHRVYKKDGGDFYMLGDAQTRPDGPYDKTHLVGKVTAIIRKGRYIPVTSLLLRFLARLWMLLRPARPALIRGYVRFRNGGGGKRRAGG